MVQSISILGIPISLVNKDTIIPTITSLLSEKRQVFIATPNPEHTMLAQSNEEFRNVLQATDLNIPDGTGVVWALRRSLKRAMEGQTVNKKLKAAASQNRGEQNSNVKTVNQEQDNPSFFKKGTRSDINRDSGEILTSTVSRVTGVDLMYQLCQLTTNISGISNNLFPSLNKGGHSAKGLRGELTEGRKSSCRVGLLGGAKGVAQKAADKLKIHIPGLDIVALPYYQYGEKDCVFGIGRGNEDLPFFTKE